MPIYAGEFDKERIVGIEVPASGNVPSHERPAARADDIFIGRRIAVVPQHDAFHASDNVTPTSERHRKAVALLKRHIRELAGPADVDELILAFHQPELADEETRIDERAEIREHRVDPPAVARREPVGVPFDTQGLAAHSTLYEQQLKIGCGIGVLTVLPDADVRNQRRELSDAQIRQAVSNFISPSALMARH